MSEKVKSAGIKREKDWLYYLDRNLNLLRAKMVRGGKKKQAGSKPELLLKTGLQRDSSYIYYLDKAGDISRVKAARGGTRHKGKKFRRTPAQRAAFLKRKLALKQRKTEQLQKKRERKALVKQKTKLSTKGSKLPIKNIGKREVKRKAA